MSSADSNLSLDEAAHRFLAGLPAEERELSQQEIYRFVRWYGRGQPLGGLAAPEVANYAEQLSLSDIDYAKKLELIRTFLAYAKKQGWTRTNLSVHLKARKGKIGTSSSAGRVLPKAMPLTRQGYAELEAELAALKARRFQSIDEVRKAAADKDFRENAPLEAAREQRGQLEGRIKELEAILKSAVVMDGKQAVSLKVNIGDSLILHDLAANEEQAYMLVSPREVDPVRGRISSASPLGKALIGRGEGEVIEVTVPAGKLRYQIKRVERWRLS